jgi:hypothetical protein
MYLPVKHRAATLRYGVGIDDEFYVLRPAFGRRLLWRWFLRRWLFRRWL